METVRRPNAKGSDAPLRVAMDIRILQGSDARRGIGHYTRGLVEAVLAVAEKENVEVFPIADRERKAPDIRTDGAAGVLKIPSPGRTPLLPWPAPSDAVALCQAARGVGADVLHVHSPLHGPFHWKSCGSMATVATVYDLIPLACRREFLDRWPGEARRRYNRGLKCLRGLDTVFAISQHTRDELSRRIDLDGVPVEILYPGVRREVLAAKDAERDTMVLALVSGNPSKNGDGLVRALARLSPGIRDRYRFRLVGPGNRAFAEWFESQLEASALTDCVEFFGEVSDASLATFYRQSSLLILPSIAEGFGLPALEAMASGTPVAASDLDVFREVLGDSAFYFDPSDAEGMARVLERALTNPEALADAGRVGLGRSKGYRWDASAAKAIECYRRLAASRTRIA
jgi:glycosyltransferase involved in cell wall biosynthesis